MRSAIVSSTGTSNRPATLRAVGLALAAALALSGCGGEGDGALPDADIALLGTDRLTWEPTSVRVQPGTLSVAIVCERGANHNLVIEETGEELAACAPGRTAFGEVTLEPGNYTMVCTVPGHERTMRAALAVAVR
jgi:plastocyanin